VISEFVYHEEGCYVHIIRLAVGGFVMYWLDYITKNLNSVYVLTIAD